MAKKLKPPKIKKLKPPKLGEPIKGLLKRGRISPKAFKALRGSQIPAHKPRGGVGAGMAGK